MADELIGGLYKDVAAANAGIPELQKQIATLQSARDTAVNEVTALKAPKPPAFGDDKGMMDHFSKAGVDFTTIAKKVIAENKYEDPDMEVIGKTIKDADPKWLGKKFAELHRHQIVTTIDADQQKAMKELGGEAKIKGLIDWQEKNGTPEQKAEWAQQWHGMDPKARRDAVERLEGRYARLNAGTSKGASESSTNTSTSDSAEGFTPASYREAKKASKAKYGDKYYEVDADFAKKYAATPASIRAQF